VGPKLPLNEQSTELCQLKLAIWRNPKELQMWDRKLLKDSVGLIIQAGKPIIHRWKIRNIVLMMNLVIPEMLILDPN